MKKIIMICCAAILLAGCCELTGILKFADLLWNNPITAEVVSTNTSTATFDVIGTIINQAYDVSKCKCNENANNYIDQLNVYHNETDPEFDGLEPQHDTTIVRSQTKPCDEQFMDFIIEVGKNGYYLFEGITDEQNNVEERSEDNNGSTAGKMPGNTFKSHERFGNNRSFVIVHVTHITEPTLFPETNSYIRIRKKAQ